MYRMSQHTPGRPLNTWKMPRSFVKWLAKLPSADVLHEQIAEKSTEDDRFGTSKELNGKVRSSFFNDGSGNGFDVVSSDEGTIFLGLDHEEHDDTVLKDEIEGVLPIDLHKLIPYASFSCVEDGCPVGVVMWRRNDEDKWHVGVTQQDVSIFKHLNQ